MELFFCTHDQTGVLLNCASRGRGAEIALHIPGFSIDTILKNIFLMKLGYAWGFFRKMQSNCSSLLSREKGTLSLEVVCEHQRAPPRFSLHLLVGTFNPPPTRHHFLFFFPVLSCLLPLSVKNQRKSERSLWESVLDTFLAPEMLQQQPVDRNSRNCSFPEYLSPSHAYQIVQKPEVPCASDAADDETSVF